ncbi:glycosyltransferase [Methylovorus mays]|uniref:glycosyltransferase n=1 Tax=Methylovorus mays TaxID=184077 RepID=UPI001E4D8609|nr:glycosyltransferase [Methylovorus mays]MCB5206571.1 glycosyltransferase [Methylovorus mays]
MENENNNFAKRYWVRRGSEDLSTGFYDPDTSKNPFSLVDSVNSQIPCIVLLGPPGIGKSTEFNNAHLEAIRKGYSTEFISLASTYSEEELINAVNEHSNEDQTTLIFLDALDESPVSIPVTQNWIIKLARKINAKTEGSNKKTYLRISSRTADWSEQFEKQLKQILGENSVLVFELAPLSKPQVLDFFVAQSPDAIEPIKTVLDSDESVLLSRPVTLRMYLNILQTPNPAQLSDRSSTYRQGILALLEESNQARRLSGAVGTLEADARFVVAGRIAAATELSTKMVIWDGLYSETVPEHAIPIHELAGGFELVRKEELKVGVKEVRETLRTGLFVQISSNSYKWSHKTLSEYLAAYYIKQRAPSSGSILSLIRSHVPGNTYVVPQLREVAAWLSIFDKSIWNELVVHEPGLLMSSDITLNSDNEKELLVSALLQKLDTLETYDKVEWRRLYKRLNHKNLANQLRPIIEDHSKHKVVRRAAIDITETCSLIELTKDLKALAFDANEDSHIRAEATHALTLLLPEDQLTELLPLALTPKNDVDDEIKGLALIALWPNHLTFEQLLSTLNEPNNHSLIGSYAFFIYDLKFTALTPNEALAAIRWVKSRAADNDDSRSFTRLTGRLLTEIWNSATDEKVLNELASFVLEVNAIFFELRNEPEIEQFQKHYLSDSPSKRQALLHTIFKVAPSDWAMPRSLLFKPWSLLKAEDLKWLVDDLISKTCIKAEGWLIQLIISLINWEYSPENEYVLNQAEKHLALKEALKEVSEVNLDSEFAKWNLKQAQTKKLEDSQPLKPSLKSIIVDLLNQCHNNNLDAFWRLNLALLETSGNRIDEFTGVLAPSPGWDLLSDQERSVVVKEAKHYLYEFLLDQNFLQPDIHHRPSAAGYRAFRLIFAESPDTYAQIPSNVWASWSLSIISFSSNDSEIEREKHRQITKDCARNAKDEFLTAFKKYLEITSNAYHAVGLIKDFIDESFLEIIWNWVVSYKPTGQNERVAFQELINNNFPPALDQAYKSLKSIEFNLDPENIDGDLEKASTLIALKPQETWEFLTHLFDTNKEVARELIKHLTNKLYDAPSSVLTQMHLAQLYVWIESLFERRESIRGPRVLNSVDHAFSFQENILRRLVAQGTSESVDAIAWLLTQLPEIDWLKYSLTDAKENQRRVEWKPLAPRDAIEQINAVQISLPIISDKETILDSAVQPSESLLIEVGLSEAVSEYTPLKEQEAVVSRPELEKLSFLLIGTEWGSEHGGVSTFNRNLCIALAAYGHKVFCFIPNATEKDIAQAAQQNVEILTANSYPGLDLQSQLARGPKTIIKPDVVIGHDHITGSPALALAREQYQCPYIHLIHTSPEEIEPHKTRPEQATSGLITYSVGNDKGETQAELCLAADIVLTVGPKLEKSIRRRLVDEKEQDLIVSILPGLSIDLLDYNRSAYQYEACCLITGRMIDASLKGADLFMQVAGDFYSNPSTKHLNGTLFVMRGFKVETMDLEIERLKKLNNVSSPYIHPKPFTADEKALMRDIKSASLFLMPSRTEGFGLAGLEAISAGIPVIISAQSGLGETILNLSNEFQSSDLRRIAKDCVIDTHPNGPEILQNWSQECAKRLGDTQKSFADANDLRRELSSKLTWESTAYSATKAALRVIK